MHGLRFSWLYTVQRAWQAVHAGRYWLYLLAVTPLVTDLIEARGAWPDTLRDWTTEIIAGGVIAMFAHKARRDYSALLAQSRLDPLTGLHNRRAFDEAIAAECARSDRTGEPLSLLFLDVDKFKRINDLHGHHAGDQALRFLGAGIRQVARARIDLGFRLGGDEFALLLPNSTASQGTAVLERIRQLCERVSTPEPIGISAGIIEWQRNESSEHFIRRADAAMYAEKRGRKRQ